MNVLRIGPRLVKIASIFINIALFPIPQQSLTVLAFQFDSNCFISLADWRKCAERNHQPSFSETSKHCSLQRGKKFNLGLCIFCVKTFDAIGGMPISAIWSMLRLRLCLQVILTPTHLAIVMEYAAGGELFERICNAGRFSEDEVLAELFICSVFTIFNNWH